MSEKLFAQFHLSRGHPLVAEKALEEMLERTPDDAEAHSLLALVLLMQGVKDKARQHSETALRLNPAMAYAHYVQSFTRLAEMGMIEIPLFGSSPEDGFAVRKAVKDVQEAIRLEPMDTAFYVRLAELQGLLNRWKDMLAAATEGLRIQPDSVPAAICRADALNRLGRREESRATLARALAANPEASDAHAGLGWALLEAGEDEKAVTFFEEALRLEPGSSWGQHGFLESVRRRFRIYRVISRWRFWNSSLPVLWRGLTNLALLAGTGVLVVKIIESIKPLPYGKQVGLAIFALFMGGFIAWLNAEAIFGWLVRREKAGRSTLAEDHRRLGLGQLGILAVGIAGAILAIATKKISRELQWGIFGIAPGLYGLWVASQFPRSRLRAWAGAYAAVILAIGIPVSLEIESRVQRLPNWGVLLLLLGPILPLAILQETEKRRIAERERQDAKKRLK